MRTPGYRPGSRPGGEGSPPKDGRVPARLILGRGIRSRGLSRSNVESCPLQVPAQGSKAMDGVRLCRFPWPFCFCWVGKTERRKNHD